MARVHVGEARGTGAEVQTFDAEPPWLSERGRPSAPVRKLDVNRASAEELIEQGFAAGAVKKLLGARRRALLLGHDEIIAAGGFKGRARELAATLVGASRPEVVLLDATAPKGRLFSNTPWSLDIRFAAPTGDKVTLISVDVRWQGRPFTVQQIVTDEESAAGRVTFQADAEHGLPPGPAELCVTLYDDGGGADGCTLGYWVLPSNPFSMFLSPGARAIYGGSVRPDWRDPRWETPVTVTFVNGDASEVVLGRSASWSFWDGPVGSGTRVESGSVDWGGPVRVPAFGTWSGSLTFSSPPGSGIHGRYESREDMAIALSFTRGDAVVQAEITCRIMAGFGVNVILVGDYTGAEQGAIATALADTRNVYEDHGLTFSGVQWWSISNAQAGGYPALADGDEFDDLVDDWTVPNDSVDCFVVRSMWGSVIGRSPTPGPTGKDGACDSDGLAVTASLGCLAHELGHYLGGIGHSDALGRGNVMHSICGGRSFTYEQYRDLLKHGYVRVVR